MDGTVVASSLVKTLFDKIGSPLLNEFSLLWGVEKDLKALESTISTVKDVLEDAEECCITDKQVYNWLRKLKENIYDADDLLDKLYLEAQRRKDESHCRTSQVINNFLSKSNPVKRFKLAHKIRSINKKLDAIAVERAKFHLKSKTVKYWEVEINYRETWSKIDEGVICGRDREKMEILSRLMQNDGRENISVISIVGLGGIGKTTLAQLTYNNENELKGYFDLRMWVYVSQRFDVRRIVRELIESVTQNKCEFENLDSLGEKLRCELKGKRFFLVLDDVWSENYDEWEKVKSILNVGAFGSKIIVTTRSMRVSQIMNAISPFNLEGLSETISWDLFKQSAFGGSETIVDSRILDIAKEIMKKCAGVPLALKALGSIMQFKENIEEWVEIRESDIWALSDGGDQVIKSLKLSYMHLPSSLKECVTYCSIFPKGEVIRKLDLIGQWIAHGLVGIPSSKGATEEDKGNEYFKHLVQMSFLQIVAEKSNGEVTCNMCDLVHDLSRSIATNEFSIMKDLDVATNINVGCRYLSLIDCSGKVEPSIVKKVRALHIHRGNLFVANMDAKAKCLRSLVLDRVGCDTLPMFSSKLIHLRYVFISSCNLTTIPEAICALWSLQALHLIKCYNITDLPESIGRLIGLRTLELDCWELKSLPGSISQCQNLRNLIVRSHQLESIPNSLGQLPNIQLLEFSRCKLKRLSVDAFEKFCSIRSICISDCWYLEEVSVSIGNLVNLESLELSECHQLKSLPESIGNLHNLRVLNLECSSIKTLPASICKLVNLVTLNLEYTALRELPKLGEMKKLRYLYTRGCALYGMPIGIGKLAELHGLNTFPINIESKYACISELEDLNFLSGNLKIFGLEELENRRKAAQANLKKKQNLKGIKLKWNSIPVSSVWLTMIETNLMSEAEAVLEALQPPSSIKRLKIDGYPGIEYPNWMMLGETNTSSFPYLTSLTLSFLKKCASLPRLAELHHLRHLELENIDSLTIISGYFPSMVELRLLCMLNVKELATMNLDICKEPGMINAYESAFPRLSKLVISDCPKMRMQPHLPPSVVELELSQSNEELLAGVYFSDDKVFSRVSSSPFIIRKFSIGRMKLLTECQLLGQLGSLKELQFYDCELDCLPKSIRKLSSLLVLMIEKCKGFHVLPEWFGELKSLKQLHIFFTPLSCLPQSMQHLTALQSLFVGGCPELEKRCEPGNGEDWTLISHIPEVRVLGVFETAWEMFGISKEYGEGQYT